MGLRENVFIWLAISDLFALFVLLYIARLWLSVLLIVIMQGAVVGW